MTSTRPAGTSRSAGTADRGSSRIFATSSVKRFASKALVPVTSSKSTQPSAQTSARRSTSLEARSCSGDR